MDVFRFARTLVLHQQHAAVFGAFEITLVKEHLDVRLRLGGIDEERVQLAPLDGVMDLARRATVALKPGAAVLSMDEPSFERHRDAHDSIAQSHRFECRQATLRNRHVDRATLFDNALPQVGPPFEDPDIEPAPCQIDRDQGPAQSGAEDSDRRRLGWSGHHMTPMVRSVSTTRECDESHSDGAGFGLRAWLRFRAQGLGL